MIFIDYGKYGYKCLDQDYSVLFAEDSAHKYLFEYTAKDLSSLPKLFDAYVRDRLDVETFTLLDGLSSDKYLKQIKVVLGSVHPYYKYEYRETCINAVGRLFNKLLLFRCYKRCTLSFETTKSQDWYQNKISWLLKPLLNIGDVYPEKFYNEYKIQSGRDFYTAETPIEDFEFFVYDVPKDTPVGFSDEIMTQEVVRNMLYFILDIMAQDLSALKMSQRVWLFNNMFYARFSGLDTNAKRRISFIQRPRLSNGNNCSQEMEQAQNLNEIFSELHSIDSRNIETNGVSEEVKGYFDLAINAAKKIETTQIYEEYEVSNLTQLLYVEIMSMIRAETMIRKCRNCGKYFVVSNRKTAYCDRIDKSGERCSAIGPSRNFQKKMGEEDALKIYTRSYKTHFARVKKGTMEKSAFAEWCKDAKEKLEQVRAGQLDIAAFQEWLKN